MASIALAHRLAASCLAAAGTSVHKLTSLIEIPSVAQYLGDAVFSAWCDLQELALRQLLAPSSLCPADVEAAYEALAIIRAACYGIVFQSPTRPRLI